MIRLLLAALLLPACAAKTPAPGLPGMDPAIAAKIRKAESLRAEAMEFLYSKDPAVKDPKKAFEKFQQAAALGDPVSMDHIGGFHSTGMAGVEKSCTKELEWYEKSAAFGYPLAMNNLAYTLVTCKDRKLRNADKAEALVKQLFQSNPGFLALLDTYAAVLAEQGDFQQAAKTMEAVVDIGGLMEANPERIDAMKETLRSYRRGKKLEDGKEADPDVFKKSR